MRLFERVFEAILRVTAPVTLLPAASVPDAMVAEVSPSGKTMLLKGFDAMVSLRFCVLPVSAPPVLDTS